MLLQSLDNLQSAEGYDDFDEKMGGDFSEFYEGHSERAESEESLEKIDCEVGKRLSLNLDPRAMNESEHDRVVKPGSEQMFLLHTMQNLHFYSLA